MCLNFTYHLHFAPLTTSSFRDPQGATFAGATCDLSLPMLSNPRFSHFNFDNIVFPRPAGRHLCRRYLRPIAADVVEPSV